MKIWCTTRSALPLIAAQGQNKPLPLTLPFDLAPQLFPLLSVLPVYLLVPLSLSLSPSPPSSFSSSFQMCKNKKNKKVRLMCASVTSGVVVTDFKERTRWRAYVSSSWKKKKKKSPLGDLLGVRKCRSPRTWFLEAFKKAPGENCGTVLKCTQWETPFPLLVLVFFTFTIRLATMHRLIVTPKWFAQCFDND